MNERLDVQQKIQNMLDEIPDPEYDDHRREYSMSKASARWIANMVLMIVESSGYNHSFTSDEAIALKNMVSERKKLLALIGAGILGILAYIGNMALHAMDAQFWKSLFAKLGSN